MGFPIVEPDGEPETITSAESEAPSEMTLEDSLRRLRLRRFQPETAAWTAKPQAEPAEPVAPSNHTIEAEPAAEEALTAAMEATAAAPADSTGAASEAAQLASAEPEAAPGQTAETAATRQETFADKAIRQTSLVLEQVAAGAAEQTRHLLGQVAAAAMQQTGRVMERLAEDAAEQTSRVLGKLAADAASQAGQTLEKLAAEETAPPLNEAVEDLSGEVRRVGRELFKTTRAAERNQDLFDSAIAELQRLTQRVEQVPGQLHSSESIVEVKAALCREMLGVADALEASLAAAQETLEQLQEQIEPAEIGEKIEAEVEGTAEGESAGPVSASAPQPFWRWVFWQEKLRQWALRLAPSPSDRNEAALREALDEAMATLSQWLDGQQLLYERLQTVMQGVGVRPIESEGQPFDPSRHRAVSAETRSDIPAGTVVGEERRGYTLDGRILRYAEVIVAKNE